MSFHEEPGRKSSDNQKILELTFFVKNINIYFEEGRKLEFVQ